MDNTFLVPKAWQTVQPIERTELNGQMRNTHSGIAGFSESLKPLKRHIVAVLILM